MADGSKAFRIEHASRTAEHSKLYQSGGYAFLAIMRSEAGLKTEAISVPTINATYLKPLHVSRRIFRSDTVVDKDGNRFLVHQILGNGTLRVAPLTETRKGGWKKIGSEAGAISISGKKILSLQVEK